MQFARFHTTRLACAASNYQIIQETVLRLSRLKHDCIHAKLSVGCQDMDARHSTDERPASSAQLEPASVHVRVCIGVHQHGVVGHAEHYFGEYEFAGGDDCGAGGWDGFGGWGRKWDTLENRA